jgi:hypothetical protein
MTTTVRIMSKGATFQAAINNLKKSGAIYNPADKTWVVKSSMSVLQRKGELGLAVVTPNAENDICRLWTIDQGCPIHGEVCH